MACLGAVVADWLAFVAARDASAGALWLMAIALGVVVTRLPERWRGPAILFMALYGVVMWHLFL